MAKKDNKTVAITLRFFTNDLPEKVGTNKKQTPVWSVGNAILESNTTRGLKAKNEFFYYFDDIPRAIEKVLKDSKIVIVENMSKKSK